MGSYSRFSFSMKKVFLYVYETCAYICIHKHILDCGEADLCNHWEACQDSEPFNDISSSFYQRLHVREMCKGFSSSRACAKSCHHPTCYCVHCRGGARTPSSSCSRRSKESLHSEPVQDDLDGKHLRELRTYGPFV